MSLRWVYIPLVCGIMCETLFAILAHISIVWEHNACLFHLRL